MEATQWYGSIMAWRVWEREEERTRPIVLASAGECEHGHLLKVDS